MKVAITGYGAWSAYGAGVAPVLAALHDGRRALAPIDRFPVDSPWLHTRLGMLAQGFTPGTGRAADPWPWAVARALDAVAAALVDAGARPDDHPATRVAVLNGTTHGSNGPLAYLRARRAGAADPDLLAHSAAETARRIATAAGARGPVTTIDTACSSGLNAIGQAALLVADGEVDRAIAGGNDLLSFLTCIGFNSLGALSPNGCRPLDRERDGLTLGDGAAYVVLERPETAARRGARVHGYVTGYACAGEGYHATAPDPEGAGAMHVMRGALARDGHPADLAAVAAHGTGTPANDAPEVAAIGAVAAHAKALVHVFALKSWLGHTLGAAGALEAVVALACFERGFVPGTWGLTDPVPHAAALRLPREPIPASVPLALCNAFGFGGSVASLALRPATSN